MQLSRINTRLCSLPRMRVVLFQHSDYAVMMSYNVLSYFFSESWRLVKLLVVGGLESGTCLIISMNI